MLTREMGYKDYGVTDGQEKLVCEWLKRLHSTEERQVIYDLALDVKASIADDMVYSLVNGLSYDKLSIIKTINYSKVDFYAYRRKLVSKIYEHVYNKSNKL